MILAAAGNLTEMFDQSFMRNAFLAGTCVALAAGLVGYFVVLRAQVFTGDALSHVAFTGALAALVIGVDLRVGLFGACVVFALLMGLLGRRGRADDAAIGSVFASILGVGALCLTLYTTSNSASNATGGVNVLFGSIFGLSGSETTTSAAIALSVSVAVVAIARPLLFASVDEAVALARGVPVRRLGLVFLVMVGVTAGEATQAVGALLLLGLIAAPAGAAQRLSARPFRALWISAAIAVLSMWIGLALAYTQPQLPPSFCILAVATGCYLLALIVTSPPARWATRRRRTEADIEGPIPAPGAIVALTTARPQPPDS